ncbi:MAG: caspase family protein [Bryobacterales bacterium]|nr:caspase family protein [Bryobacterales bacterium]
MRAVMMGMILTAVLWAQSADPPITPFLRIETGTHTATIWRMSGDAEGRYLVTCSDDKTARVWDAASGRLLRILRPPQGGASEGKLYSVAMAPDGRQVAVGGFTSAFGLYSYIYVFDTSSGSLIAFVSGLPQVVTHLAYSPNGTFLAAGLGGSNGVRIFRTHDLTEVSRDTAYGDGCYGVDFAADGRMVTTSRDGLVRMYSSDFKLQVEKLVPAGKQPYSVRFSRDGRQIAVGFNDSVKIGVLNSTNLSTMYERAPAQSGDRSLSAVAWSLDGSTLYAAGRYQFGNWIPVLNWSTSNGGTAVSWYVSSNTVMDLQPLPHGRVGFAAQNSFGVLNPDGTFLWRRETEVPDYRMLDLGASRSAEAIAFTVGAFDFHSGQLRKRPAFFDVLDARLTLDSPVNSDLLPQQTTGLAIQDWRDSFTPILNGSRLPLDEYEMSRSLAVNTPPDKFLLGTEWWLRMFSDGGKQLWQASVPGVACAVNLSRDGRYALAALADGTIRWYDAAAGNEILALFVHPDAKRWVAWTPEGFFHASPGGEKLIGYHLNQGRNREGEFINIDQAKDLFYRPELVRQRLQPGGAEAVRAAVAKLGDAAAILRSGLPPELELLSEAAAESTGEYTLRFRVKNRGGGIGRVVYRIDGQEVQGRPVDIPTPGTDILQVRLPLAPGRRQVTASVFNSRNQLESRAVTATINVRQTDQRPSLYVISAGITNYRDNSLSRGVQFAAADAKAVAARLSEQAEGLFGTVSIHPLTNEQVTAANLKVKIAELAPRIRPIDVFVLYLAGHGKAFDGDYHFIPWETRYTNEAALRAQSLDQERLRQLLAQIPARKTLLLLDTCNSGAFAGRGIDEKSAIDRLSKVTGRAVLAASASEQMALEGYQGHGVFTYALLEGLLKAAGPDGFVEVSKLADFIEDTVPTITKQRWGYEQFPMRDLKGQTFPIARKPTR